MGLNQNQGDTNHKGQCLGILAQAFRHVFTQFRQPQRHAEDNHKTTRYYQPPNDSQVIVHQITNNYNHNIIEMSTITIQSNLFTKNRADFFHWAPQKDMF